MKTRKSFRITPVKGRVCVLVSGGLDSSVLLAQVAGSATQVFPLYIRTGLRWEREELKVLRVFIRKLSKQRIAPLTVLELPMDDVADRDWSRGGDNIPGYTAPVESNYILGRNLTLLSKAAIFCARHRVGVLAMALLKGNPFPDASSAFLNSFSRAVRLGVGLPMQVTAPMRVCNKAQLIQLGRGLPLRWTVSCIRPRGNLHCGQCTKCAERAMGFKAAGVPDPTRYRHKPQAA